jgi:hypothetical protein
MLTMDVRLCATDLDWFKVMFPPRRMAGEALRLLIPPLLAAPVSIEVDIGSRVVFAKEPPNQKGVNN